jgi:hypothetical protein
VAFTVNTPSYFRMYTEPHHIDIDLALEANGQTVTKAISFNLEEVEWGEGRAGEGGDRI